MNYTIRQLAKMAGVSTRTLRYYDEIGLLKPAQVNSSGYRIYGRKEVDRLQQILFYRELDMSLEDIKKIVNSPDYDPLHELRRHREKLLKNRNRLDLILNNIDKTIKSLEGRMVMTDKEKFEGFKQKLIDENEKKYGKEIREKYGNDTIDKANMAFKNLTAEQYEEMEKLSALILESLKEAMAGGNPAGEQARKVVELHRKWLTMAWGHYNKEAHCGLAKMYVDDERFRSYYDKVGPGAAEFLRDAILTHAGGQK